MALFDRSLAHVGTISVNLDPLVTYAEGLFQFSGVPVRRAVLDFDERVTARFAIDNLTYFPIPEPRSAVLGTVSFGLLAIACYGSRRRARIPERAADGVHRSPIWRMAEAHATPTLEDCVICPADQDQAGPSCEHVPNRSIYDTRQDVR